MGIPLGDKGGAYRAEGRVMDWAGAHHFVGTSRFNSSNQLRTIRISCVSTDPGWVPDTGLTVRKAVSSGVMS